MKFIRLSIVLFLLSSGVHAQKTELLKKIGTITHKEKPAIKPMAANLENYEYPFPVSYINLTLQEENLKMAYMDLVSKKPNGETVVLLHGKNFCAAYWKKTALELSKAGYRVVMPDQIGFGKSSKPQHLHYSFQLLAQNTKVLLDTLNIQSATVLGHSMGGMLATRVALMYPDLVKKLILENPIGLEDYRIHIPYMTIDEHYKKELKQTHDRIKDYQLTNYYGDHWKPEYDEWVNLLAGWTLSADYPRIAWNAALTTDMIITQPVCYEFENIKAPTLLIIGQRDRTALINTKTPDEVKSKLGNYPELGKSTSKKISNSQLIEIDQVGHLPHVEAYLKFIAPVLTFLKTEIKAPEEKEEETMGKNDIENKE